MKPDFAGVAKSRLDQAVKNPKVKSAGKPPSFGNGPRPMAPPVKSGPGFNRHGQIKKGWRATADGIPGNPVKRNGKLKKMPPGKALGRNKVPGFPPGLANAAAQKLKNKKKTMPTDVKKLVKGKNVPSKDLKEGLKSVSARGTKWYK